MLKRVSLALAVIMSASLAGLVLTHGDAAGRPVSANCPTTGNGHVPPAAGRHCTTTTTPTTETSSTAAPSTTATSTSTTSASTTTTVAPPPPPVTTTATTPPGGWWHPKPGLKWQWQLSGT